MTSFVDGPAHGVSLGCRRVPMPMFLRVTQGATAEFDALDQWEDFARPDEVIYAYQINGEQGWCHIRASKGRGGMFAVATYRYIKEQPSDAVMRDNAKWAEWATAKGSAMR